MKYKLLTGLAWLYVALMFLFLVWAITSCNKVLGKTCWECEITRVDGSTYKDNICTENGDAPQIQDGNGNDLGSYCERK